MTGTSGPERRGPSADAPPTPFPAAPPPAPGGLRRWLSRAASHLLVYAVTTAIASPLMFAAVLENTPAFANGEPGQTLLSLWLFVSIPLSLPAYLLLRLARRVPILVLPVMLALAYLSLFRERHELELAIAVGSTLASLLTLYALPWLNRRLWPAPDAAPLTRFTRRELTLYAVVALFLVGLLVKVADDRERDAYVIEPTMGPKLTEGSRRVLLIGSSILFWNDLPWILSELAAHASPPRRLDVQLVARGGGHLPGAWEAGPALEVLRQHSWDDVVLQENTWETVRHPAEMLAATRLFDAEIKAAGARTVLLMSWNSAVYLHWVHPATASILRALRRLGLPYALFATDPVFHLNTQPFREGDRPLPLEPWIQANLGAADAVGASMAPVGIAFRLAGQALPELKLLEDGNHPTPAGSYLMAAVLYATLYQESPEGLANRLSRPMEPGRAALTLDLPPEDAATLQRTAWQAVHGMASIRSEVLDPGTPEGLFALAQIYAHQGRSAEAARLYGRCVELGGNGAAFARQNLEQGP